MFTLGLALAISLGLASIDLEDCPPALKPIGDIPKPLPCSEASFSNSHLLLLFLSRFIRNISCETSEDCESYRSEPTRLVLSPVPAKETAGIRVPV